MSLSSTEICNSALIKVGADRIDDITDLNKRARLCNEQYDKKRKNLIAAHPWNFATKRVALSPDAATPLYEFDVQYTLPADCLRVVGTNLLVDQEWKVEGRKILCNDSSLSIKYIFDQTDTTKFTPHFDEALASDIARDIAYAITQSNSRADSLKKDYDLAIRDARSFDAQEGTVEQVEAFDWSNARF